MLGFLLEIAKDLNQIPKDPLLVSDVFIQKIAVNESITQQFDAICF